MNMSRLAWLGEKASLRTEEIALYTSADLKLIQKILDDILSELADREGSLVSNDVAVKVKLATALFAASADGDRDYSRLRQNALAAALP